MADKDSKASEGVERDDLEVKSVGVPYGREMRRLAADLPEKDEVQEAYKAQILAGSAQAEAKEKVKIVDASPDAADTPSGYALKKVAGISSDEKRGEEYAKHRAAARMGTAEPTDS